MFGDKRVEKKKTPVYKCNLNPIFNAAFEFDVPWEQIRDCALDIQVRNEGVKACGAASEAAAFFSSYIGQQVFS
jgi:hypothetical protein